MAIKPIVKIGNAQLAKPSLSVTDFTDNQLKILVEDMRDTMQARQGAGIAAPQIGVYLRVIMFGFDYNERYPNEAPVPFTILINPSFQVLTEEMEEGWEGCLSVPGLRGLVPRYRKIEYQGYTLEGKLVSVQAEGFHARIVQHEYDHIEGILFPSRAVATCPVDV